MKNLIIFGLFVIALILVQFAQAQTVDEVINKYTDARGGKDKLLAIKSIYMEGTRQMMGNDLQVKVTKVQDKLSRTDFEVGGTNNFLLITDKEGWNFFAMRMQAPEPMPADRVKQLRTELDIAGPLVDYAAKGYKAELVGKDTADGIVCNKIKLTTKGGKEVFYWIDAKTNLLYQSSQKGSGFGGRGGEVEIVTVYKDYKAVEGVLFSFSTELKGAMAGSPLVYEKIEANKPVDEKLYKPE